MSHEASFPPAWPRSSERRGKCLWTFVCCARVRLCLFSSSPHARQREELREVTVDRSRVRSSCGSRSSDQRARKDRRARSRSDSSRDRGCRSHSSYRSRSRGLERRGRPSSRSLSSRERSCHMRLRSSDRSRSRRVHSHSLGERFRSSDRYQSRRDCSRRDCSHRDRSRSSDCYQSRRQRARSPGRRGAWSHAIPRVVLVTAHGLVDDYLHPLTVRGQGRKDGEPDESSRRVWRR